MTKWKSNASFIDSIPLFLLSAGSGPSNQDLLLEKRLTLAEKVCQDIHDRFLSKNSRFPSSEFSETARALGHGLVSTRQKAATSRSRLQQPPQNSLNQSKGKFDHTWLTLSQFVPFPFEIGFESIPIDY
jgi:hypothetical protein